jgi:lipoate-protein ligase A
MTWRVVDYTENDAFANMAIDEAVSESVAGGGPPTIRFYGWRPSAVSIGYFQSLEKEVDTARCREEGVDIVRRRTGGGAVYHDTGGEMTYSVIGREGLFPKDIIASYRLICGWVISSLGKIGLEAEFKPINDVTISGRKVSGNAQTRRGGVLLQHGTVLYSVDPERMFSLLRVPDEKIRDKMISAARERVTSVSDQKSVTRDQLYRALLAGFTEGKEVSFGSISPREIARSRELEASRYRTDAWNLMR